jgi:hypothetical protein
MSSENTLFLNFQPANLSIPVSVISSYPPHRATQLSVSYMRREVDGRGISGTRFVANPS